MGKEKRRNPRLKERLPFEIGSQDAAISTETKNISCSGAYCYIDRALPVMSKVKISMVILSKNITCEGVVLRYDPPQKEDNQSGWNTAIMFTKISRQDKNTIADYVKYQLEKNG